MNRDNIKYFIPKLKGRIRSFPKYFWPYCNMERLSMRSYEPFQSASTFKEQIVTMLGTFSASLFDGINHVDRDCIVESANQALHHEFDLLGSGVVKSDPINWHVDLKSGKKWDKQFYSRIGHISGADIKMPWELSRCQHLLWLGEAYLITSDERYAQEIIDEIIWWIDDNPFMYTVNWKCAMDVAFRAVNWLFALNMISRYDGFDDKFATKVTRSLWQHGFFIRNNLEKVIPYSNNHYASNIVGLLYIGALFKHTSKGRSWFRFALKEYYKEVLTQILPSGVHYERSVSYHRLMTELFSYPIYMLKRMGENVSQNVDERIKKMYKYVATYTKPNGYAPLIADNDDGRFVPLLRRDLRQHNYLNGPNSVENVIVAVGLKPLFCMLNSETRLYSDAGVAIVRMGDSYLFINNGGYSKFPHDNQSLIGTHTHNDLLSFELSLDGKDIIIDPGTYLYTSSKTDRNAFRSTAKHNTVMVDDEEQNGMVETFYLKRNVHSERLREIKDGFEGEYVTIEGRMSHRRQFILSTEKLTINDYITKSGSNHEAKLYFHFAQGIAPVIKENKVLLNDDETTLSFSVPPHKLEINDDNMSPSFGVLVPVKTLVAAFVFDNEINIGTIILSK